MLKLSQYCLSFDKDEEGIDRRNKVIDDLGIEYFDLINRYEIGGKKGWERGAILIVVVVIVVMVILQILEEGIGIDNILLLPSDMFSIFGT